MAINNELLTQYISKLNELNDKLDKITFRLDNHINSTMKHYDTTMMEELIENINELKESVSTANQSAIEPFNSDEIDSMKYLAKHKNTFADIQNYMNIILNYISSTGMDISGLNTPNNDVTITDNTTVINYNTSVIHESTEDTNNEESFLISPYRIEQNDSYRFVTQDQIELWSSTAEKLTNLISRINYTEDTNILNIKKLPMADSSTDGLMSSENISILKTLIDKIKQPDWKITVESDPGYIKNKPESMPANGGNAKTVGGLSAADIKSRNKISITIGYGYMGNYNYNVENMSLKEIFADIDGNNTGSELSKTDIDIAPGIYFITEDLNLCKYHIDGHGSQFRFVGENKITLDNTIMENIDFNNSSSSATSTIVLKDNNTIRNCRIVSNVEICGSNNDVLENCLICVYIFSESNKVYYNNISNNRIYTKLVMYSENNPITDNIVCNNMVKCIILRGREITYNNISNNTILNNTAKTYNIIVNCGYKNIISNNVKSSAIVRDILRYNTITGDVAYLSKDQVVQAITDIEE